MLPRITSVLLTLLCVTVVVSTATDRAEAGQRFTNPRPLFVPDATAAGPGLAPVASTTITVPQVLAPTDRVQQIRVEVNGIWHRRLADLDILLVPPAASGRPAVLVMSDVSGSANGGLDIAVRDDATNPMPSNPNSNSYGYKPTDLAPADTFPGLGPMTVTTDLSILKGIDPVGDWQLWVVDDQEGEAGLIAEGWTLALTLGPNATESATPIAIASPASAGALQQASPFASTVTLSNIVGNVTWMRVTLKGLTHAHPDDLEIVLRTPSGYCYALMRDVGGAAPVSNVDLGFDFSAEPWLSDYGSIPQAGPVTPGVFRSSSYTNPADPKLDPATLGCGSITGGPFLSDVDPAVANGDWTLFVADDTPGNDGSLAGWTLEVGHEVNAPAVSTQTSQNFSIPAVTATVTGRVMQWFDSRAVTAMRWRLLLAPDDASSTRPNFSAEGPWTPIPGGPAFAGEWTLTDIPLHWGKGELCLDFLSDLGTIASTCRQINLPQPHYTLSEGATGPFFDLDIAVFNPTDAAAHADIQFLKRSGEVITQGVDLPAKGRKRIDVEQIAGLEGAEVSTIVTPTTVTPLVVERSMFWDDTRYGGHGANATEPSTRWYFAEGAQGFYRTYVLLANPNDTPANVTLRFLIEGGKPKDHTVTVAPHARETVDCGAIPQLISQAFGITITSDVKIVAERAMYFNQGGRLWEGGHESTGVSQPARQWLLAEGATGSFFTTFVLVSNPNSYETEVTMEFLKEDGSIVRKTYPLAAYGRLSVNIRGEHPTLAFTGVSTSVTSNDNIVVERAMYWPGSPLEWTEAHNGFGITQAAPTWGLADGRVGGELHYATYILLANSGDDPAFVSVLFSLDDGQQVTRSFKVEPHSRKTIDAGVELKDAAPGGTEFSNVITTDAETPIAVERATYWNSTDGRHWAGGSNVQGTKLP